MEIRLTKEFYTKKCKSYLFKNEWFHKAKDVIKIFNEYESDPFERMEYLLKRSKCKNRSPYVRKAENQNPIIQLTFDFKIVGTWASQIAAQRHYNLANGAISRVINKENRSAGGFKWKTVDSLSKEEKTSLKICGETTLKTE